MTQEEFTANKKIRLQQIANEITELIPKIVSIKNPEDLFIITAKIKMLQVQWYIVLSQARPKYDYKGNNGLITVANG